MKCPNCGREMAEGSLYCEHCGEDIHIVPDFEPEIEFNIEQTISDIVGEFQDEIPDTAQSKEKPPQRSRRMIFIMSAVLLFVVLIVFGYTVIKTYRYHSEEYQVERASYYVEKEQYTKAIACYNRALELNSGDIELLFRLAEVYFLENNKTEYEAILREIVSRKDATAEQLESAYGKIIAIYRAKEDYQTINDLLLASENAAILSAYWNYIATVVEYSIPEGYYTGIQALKLSASGSGKIYYTMDGSEPTTESSQYTAPLILEKGEYTITAVFVNDKGIASDIVTKVYHIENDEIYAPEVSLLSGDYYFPTNIEILSTPEDVYYTTDGTDPTYSSNEYMGPIPMPLGKSVYKFAKIVDGVTGTITTRNFYLEMNTDFTPEEAVETVVQYALRIGKIYDPEGFFDGSGDCYCYEYQYVTNINQIDDFYIVAEIYRTAAGALTKTGNNFAVNAYTGKLFKLHQGEGKMSLVELEIKTDSY